MKKKVLSLLLVAAMGISMLVGCGGNAGSTENNSESGPKAITLKVWCPQNQIDSGLIAEQQKAFAEANKDKWTITWETAAVGEDTAYTEVSKDVEAAADVFFYANDQVTKFLEIGAIARLGGETEKMVNDTMAAAVVDTVKVDGALYGIPFTHNTFFMYYDKTLLTEEDIKSLDTIVAKETGDGVYNFLFDSAGGWKLGAWYYGAGCSVFGADGSDLAAGCDWNQATGVAVTNYLIDLLNNKKVASSGKAEELAAEHKLGAWFDGAWAYNTYHDVLGDNLGMATIPTYKLDGKDVQLKGFYGSKAIGVNAQSKNIAAAVAFAAFLGSEEQQLARFEKSAQIPTNITAAASDKVQSDAMAAVIVAEANNCSVAQPTASVFGSRYWTYADTIPTGIKTGEITKDNVQAKLDEMVLSMTAE
jgi:arabinogalactan oligomer/maltooligosaccharide transport system substrate-binding protein